MQCLSSNSPSEQNAKTNAGTDDDFEFFQMIQCYVAFDVGRNVVQFQQIVTFYICIHYRATNFM